MSVSKTVWLSIAVIGFAVGAHAEPTVESMRAGAATGFHLQLGQPGAGDFGAIGTISGTRAKSYGNFAQGADLSKFDTWLKTHVVKAKKQGVSVTAQSARTEVVTLDLKALKNRHIAGSTLRYTLGGKKVVISGGFDRDQNAYVSIKVGDKEASFYNVRDLVETEESVTAGTNKYLLYLSPNLSRPMKSQIVLENEADEDEQIRISIKKLLAAISAAGDTVAATGQTYQAFYYDDIKGKRADPKSQSYAFVLTDEAGEFHVFLVPAELVIETEPTRFKMHKNHELWLQLVDGKLKITE